MSLPKASHRPYDLDAAFERLGIPDGLKEKTLFIQIPFDYSMGIAYKPPVDIYVVISGADQVSTDYTMAHELLGHAMDNNDYSGMNWIERWREKEHRALKVGLETLLELEQRHPGHGYLEKFDSIVRRHVEPAPGLITRLVYALTGKEFPSLDLLSPDRLLFDYIYTSGFDFPSLIERRAIKHQK